MRPPDLALAVILPALLLLAYGMVKTQRTPSHAALRAGFVAALVVLVWELRRERVPRRRLCRGYSCWRSGRCSRWLR